jgi:hypothetical protein
VALLLAAVARWRRLHWATTAVRAAALLVIAVHLYGALNADRNVGPFAALVAIGWSVGMLLVTLRQGDAAPRPSRSPAQ